MSNTDRDSMLERWADGMEKLEKHYEDLYGPPSTPATLPDVTDHNGMLAAIADELERARLNINKHSTVYHDTKSAYAKTVPANTKEASIEKVGGRTLVWNQLCDFHSNSTTFHGITWTKNADNSYTANGTADSSGSWLDVSATFSIPTDHKILIKGCPAGGSNSTYNLKDGYIATWRGADFGNGFIYAQRLGTNVLARMQIEANVTVSNVTFRPLVFDLTAMFGPGNEPSTVAEFEAMFPNSYYEYNEGTLLSAGITDVVSMDSNNVTLQTYSVPAEIQALDGYGLSCPNHYNYIDFEAKKFVQEVGSRAYAEGDESDSAVVTDGSNTHYALDTPVETDISAYLTDDTRIEVEAGGTLTFPNSNGDDYRIPVPSTETFWVDIS